MMTKAVTKQYIKMGMILTYEDFLIKENFITVEESKANLLLTIAERCSANELESLKFFINEGFTDDLFDIAISVDESFAEKFKEMAEKAKERAKELGKAAKDKLGDGAKAALKFGGNIMAALKSVLEKIKGAISEMWEYVKGKAVESAQQEIEDITKALDPKLKDENKRKTLKEEVENLGKIGASVTKFIGTDFIGLAAKSGVEVANESEFIIFDDIFEASFYQAAAEVIREGYSLEEAEKELTELNVLLEGGHGDGTSAKGLHIPFISTIMRKLSQVPPFNVLHKAEAAIAKGTEKGLNAFSQFASKVAGAPGPFTFPVMAGIIGIIAGYMIEQKVKQGMLNINDLLIKALGFGVPGIGTLYKFMKYGGMCLATYGIVENLLGKYENDHEKDHKEGEESSKNIHKK